MNPQSIRNTKWLIAKLNVLLTAESTFQAAKTNDSAVVRSPPNANGSHALPRGHRCKKNCVDMKIDVMKTNGENKDAMKTYVDANL